MLLVWGLPCGWYGFRGCCGIAQVRTCIHSWIGSGFRLLSLCQWSFLWASLLGWLVRPFTRDAAVYIKSRGRERTSYSSPKSQSALAAQIYLAELIGVYSHKHSLGHYISLVECPRLIGGGLGGRGGLLFRPSFSLWAGASFIFTAYH